MSPIEQARHWLRTAPDSDRQLVEDRLPRIKGILLFEPSTATAVTATPLAGLEHVATSGHGAASFPPQV